MLAADPLSPSLGVSGFVLVVAGWAAVFLAVHKKGEAGTEDDAREDEEDEAEVSQGMKSWRPILVQPTTIKRAE